MSHHSIICQLLLFINVTLNVNKKILQIALLKPTPYRTTMLVSFLEDVT